MLSFTDMLWCGRSEETPISGHMNVTLSTSQRKWLLEYGNVTKLLCMLWAIRKTYLSYHYTLCIFTTQGHSHLTRNGVSLDLTHSDISVKENKWELWFLSLYCNYLFNGNVSCWKRKIDVLAGIHLVSNKIIDCLWWKIETKKLLTN